MPLVDIPQIWKTKLQSMNSERIATVVSLLISSAIAFFALTRTPSVQHELANHLWPTLGMIAILFLAFLPWFLSYSKAQMPGEQGPVWVFSILAMLICAGFYVPMSTSPAEGIGYAIIECLVVVWIVYAIARKLKAEPGESNAA